MQAVTPLFTRIRFCFRRKPDAEQWINWFENLTELIASDLPLNQALEISLEVLLMHSKQNAMADCIRGISQRLQQGDSLVQAFIQANYTLPNEILLALECAQHSGNLKQVLTEHLRRWKARRQAQLELQQSLSYPVMVLCIALVCWLFLDQTLTRFSPKISDSPFQFSNSELFLIAGVVLLIGVGLFNQWKKPTTASTNPLSLYGILPGQAWYISQFFFAIEQELRSGQDLLHCLRQRPYRLRNTAPWLKKRHQQLNQFSAQLNRAIKDGASFSEAMRSSHAPEFMQRQAKVAEQTGHLASAFEMANRVFELEARNRQQRLKKTLGPVTLMIAALTLALAYQYTIAPLYQNLSHF